ncbi:hypothetical protein TNCV_1144821 [Trichonephila clavipes]|nr:hypothetical protein TNCV_1144821 [Trichonephila clavipes]
MIKNYDVSAIAMMLVRREMEFSKQLFILTMPRNHSVGSSSILRALILVTGNHGSLVVKGTDSWPACRGAMHAKSVEAQMSSRWCGVVVRREGCQSSNRPHRLTMLQNYVVRCQ